MNPGKLNTRGSFMDDHLKFFWNHHSIEIQDQILLLGRQTFMYK